MNITKGAILLAIGFFVGLAGGLSILRTTWSSLDLDFFLWWSITSALLNVVLAGISIWQYWESKSQIVKNNAQVKVWMQDADGIRQALQRIIGDNYNGRYSTTNDLGNAIWGVEANARALYQSLYEERCVTEDQYKERQKKIAELLDRKQFADLEKEAIDAEGKIHKTPSLPLPEVRP